MVPGPSMTGTAEAASAPLDSSHQPRSCRWSPARPRLREQVRGAHIALVHAATARNPRRRLHLAKLELPEAVASHHNNRMRIGLLAVLSLLSLSYSHCAHHRISKVMQSFARTRKRASQWLLAERSVEGELLLTCVCVVRGAACIHIRQSAAKRRFDHLVAPARDWQRFS